MDSMKSLNTSLPRSSTNTQQAAHPSEELLQSFKNAALSVTNLYRAAEVSERRGVQTGYQDALDDLLAFLDRENIGLGDGEGWRIRQWATERLDDHPSQPTGSESEDEKPQKSSSPSHDRPLDHAIGSVDHEMTSMNQEQQPKTNEDRDQDQSSTTPNKTQDIFTFQSPQMFRAESATTTHDPSNSSLPNQYNSIPPSAAPTLTLNVQPRTSKFLKNGRQIPRPSNARNLGIGAGSKRRAPFSEYFDLPELGGGKKGKYN